VENSGGSPRTAAIILRMPHVYILRCSDASYYVGSTWHLDARIEQHSTGHGAEYTRRRLPVELVFSQEYEWIDDAFAMEKRIQNWSRAKREALISGEVHKLPALSKKKVWKKKPL
jgi:putative endonuclease